MIVSHLWKSSSDISGFKFAQAGSFPRSFLRCTKSCWALFNKFWGKAMLVLLISPIEFLHLAMYWRIRPIASKEAHADCRPYPHCFHSQYSSNMAIIYLEKIHNERPSPPKSASNSRSIIPSNRYGIKWHSIIFAKELIKILPLSFTTAFVMGPW